MPKLWNGQDLAKSVPEFGMTLPFASLVPEFASQLLLSSYCDVVQPVLLTPLDDLKAWLRANPKGRGEHCEQVREVLLGHENRARLEAEAKGGKFDLVEYDLVQMEADPTFEQFDPEWTKLIFELVLDEADSLQAWAREERNENFLLGASFALPDPAKHLKYKITDIEAALRKFGAQDDLLRRALLHRGKPLEFTGALELELLPKGQAKAYPASKETAFVKVPLEDARAGDDCDAAFSLLYPRELEGYFLQSFDSLRQALTLKGEL